MQGSGGEDGRNSVETIAFSPIYCPITFPITIILGVGEGTSFQATTESVPPHVSNGSFRTAQTVLTLQGFFSLHVLMSLFISTPAAHLIQSFGLNIFPYQIFLGKKKR